MGVRITVQQNIIGIAMELDVSDLKSGLAETRKAITTANKQFQASTAGMDNWKESIAGVDAKLTQLATVLKNQKKNLAGYEAELERVTEEYGENSEQARKLRDKILDCQTAIAKTEKAQRNYASTMDKLQGEYIETIKDADRLESAIDDLGSILNRQKKAVADYESALSKAKAEHGDTSEEVRQLTKKLNDAKSAVEKTEKAQQDYKNQLNKVQSETNETRTATKKMGDAMDDAKGSTINLKGGFTVLKGAMANLVSTGIQSVVSGLQNIVTESREFRTEMSYLQSTADDTGASFDQAKDKVKEVYAVLGETDSAVEGMNNLMTAGFSGDSLDKITDQLVGASVKWHDTLKFEGLADGLQETLATGKAIGPFAELLERGGMNLEKFDDGLAKCKTDAEKQNYVLQQLNKLGLSEITEGYRKSNKELVEGAEAQFEYEEASAAVGAKVEPVMTTIKQGWVDVLGAILDTSDGVGTAGIQDAIKGAFTWFIEECIPFIKDAVKFVIDHQTVILSLIAGIGAGFAAWKVVTVIQGIITAFKVWKTTTEGVTIAQKLLNTVMNMNPIGLVIAAIAALVAIFVVLWNKCDWFREFWIDLWDNIKEVAGVVWKAITDFFTKAWAVIKQTWSVVADWFGKVWKGISKAFSKVGSYFKDRFTEAWRNVKNAWSGVAKWFSDIWNNIKRTFSNVSSTLTGFFKNAWSGIKNAWSGVTGWFGNIWSKIKSTFSSVGSTLGGFFRSAWNNVKNAFSGVGSWASGIVSKIVGFFKGLPGKLKSIGKDMMNGLIKGVKSMANSVKDAVENAVDSAVKGVKNFLGIESPSKLMRDEVGRMMGLGIGEGILASGAQVLKDAQSFTKRITDGLNGQADVIGSGLNGYAGVMGRGTSTKSVINNFTQVINAPKTPSRIDLYRQSKNLLSMKG